MKSLATHTKEVEEEQQARIRHKDRRVTLYGAVVWMSVIAALIFNVFMSSPVTAIMSFACVCIIYFGIQVFAQRVQEESHWPESDTAEKRYVTQSTLNVLRAIVAYDAITIYWDDINDLAYMMIAVNMYRHDLLTHLSQEHWVSARLTETDAIEMRVEGVMDEAYELAKRRFAGVRESKDAVCAKASQLLSDMRDFLPEDFDQRLDETLLRRVGGPDNYKERLKMLNDVKESFAFDQEVDTEEENDAAVESDVTTSAVTPDSNPQLLLSEAHERQL